MECGRRYGWRYPRIINEKSLLLVKLVNLVETEGLGDRFLVQGLTNDDLHELVEQGIKGENSVSEDDERKESTTDSIKKSLETITEIISQIVANGPNFYRSAKARRGVLDAIACFRH
ncbi:hypothetical protein QE152_g11033 [Popillia japonica]|uniref:Uncharacterized protein n=1 Tax=Popillia japonica TaxID=7064 RepID=A0AAW1LT77_POPJA